MKGWRGSGGFVCGIWAAGRRLWRFGRIGWGMSASGRWWLRRNGSGSDEDSRGKRIALRIAVVIPLGHDHSSQPRCSPLRVGRPRRPTRTRARYRAEPAKPTRTASALRWVDGSGTCLVPCTIVRKLRAEPLPDPFRGRRRDQRSRRVCDPMITPDRFSSYALQTAAGAEVNNLPMQAAPQRCRPRRDS